MAANINGGLSDEEIVALAKLPRINKSKIYARAEAWMAEHRAQLEREYPCKYLYMDVTTLLFTIGDNHQQAIDQWYGPLPREGRYMLGIQLK